MRLSPVYFYFCRAADHPLGIWLLLCTFLLLRMLAFTIWPGWSVAVGYAGDSDAPYYHEIAQQLALHGRFANADGALTLVRPPGFPFWLALLYRLLGPEATWAGYVGQQLLLTLIAGAIWLLGRAIFNRRVAFAAALLVSVDPVLIYLGWTYLTEPLHILFLLLGLGFFVRSLQTPPGKGAALAMGAGLLWSAATLTRPYFQFFPLFLLPLAALQGRRASQLALLASLVMIVGFAPWLLRNRLVLGEWTSLTLNSGVTLWGGNNPYASGDWVESAEHPELYRDAPHTSEKVSDDWFRAQAVDWIKSNPIVFVRLAALKVYRLFHFYNFTTRESFQWLFLLGGLFPYLISLPFALGVILQRVHWQNIWPILAVILPTVVSALIFYGDVRIRTPIEPLILLLAAIGMVRAARITGNTPLETH